MKRENRGHMSAAIDIFDLSGKVAIVTGAGRGLGKAMAKALAKAGADIVVPDIDLDNARTTAKDIESLGQKAIALKVDVTSLESVREMVNQTENSFGQIHILVNNAGIQRVKAAHEMSLDDWDSVINVDLRGVFICCHEVGKSMIKSGGGKIINIASVHGNRASFLHPAVAYNSAKAGVSNMTRSLATEWAKYKIYVNAIAPGLFTKDVFESRRADPEYNRRMMERIPLARLAIPDELAGPVIFLASKASDYVTGHVLVVDGGWLCHS